ncbi:hypothetical protein D770_12175 [Flammeovirgaceae bacterium 311]|nr:hypothetical protein D770_12175 [Flammeovirgaceae bacterium 311]
MLFLPIPPDESTFLPTSSSSDKLQFYWEGDVGEEVMFFHLYEEAHLVATLCIPRKQDGLVQIELNSMLVEFKDCSSFFSSCLLLANRDSGQSIGYIKKSNHKLNEGTISLHKQTYAWKIQYCPDGKLILMDHQKRKLFSYHFTPDFVRLLLSNIGRNDSKLIYLLCIGLYLLPIWHRAS